MPPLSLKLYNSKTQGFSYYVIVIHSLGFQRLKNAWLGRMSLGSLIVLARSSSIESMRVAELQNGRGGAVILASLSSFEAMEVKWPSNFLSPPWMSVSITPVSFNLIILFSCRTVSASWPGSITKPPLLQRSRLTGGGSPNLVDLVERKALQREKWELQIVLIDIIQLYCRDSAFSSANPQIPRILCILCICSCICCILVYSWVYSYTLAYFIP